MPHPHWSALALFLLSCNPITSDDFEKYTIKEGRHYSTPFHQGILTTSHQSIEFYFTEESLYHLDGVDSLDWNKLYGFKSDLSSPPKQAVMLAWRCLNGQMQVAPYINDNGIIQPQYPINVNLYEKIASDIWIYDNSAYISVKDSLFSYKTKKRVRVSISPYFGGNRKAPKDISLYLKYGV